MEGNVRSRFEDDVGKTRLELTKSSTNEGGPDNYLPKQKYRKAKSSHPRKNEKSRRVNYSKWRLSIFLSQGQLEGQEKTSAQ